MASGRSLRSRSSRFSSPANVSEKESERRPAEATGSRGGPRTLLEKWIEPPLRPPAPSFEDTKGLERVGVLEHMAPLGQPPTQKLLQKLKLGPSKLSHRATVVQNEESLTPSTDVERVDLASPVDLEMRSVSVNPDDPVPLSNSVGRGSFRQENGEISPKAVTTPSPQKAASLQNILISPQSSSIPDRIHPEHIQTHVDSAIQEAEQKGNRNLVPGLQKLREDAQLDPQLWVVLDAVLHRSPSHSQFRVFRRYIKAGVKQYNENSTNSTSNSLFTPINNNTEPSRPVASSSHSSAFPHTSHPLAPSMEAKSAITPPIRLKKQPVQIQSSPSKSISLSLSTSLSPAKMTSGGHVQSTSSPRRRRSGSVSSSSSLSSAKSLPDAYAPIIDADAEGRLNGMRHSRSTGQRQGAHPIVAGNRTRSSATLPSVPKHPFSDFNTTSKFVARKLKKFKDDVDIDQAEILSRKRELLELSFHDYDQQPKTDSNERTDLGPPHHFEPSSSFMRVQPPVVHPHQLIPSQVALPSPLSTKAPTEQLLQNGNSRKRSYHEIDQDDTEVQTPLSSSPGPTFAPPPPGAAASSRAATPRAVKFPPPAKVRKSARVMVSPNKPKNGGITAGISRTGPGRDSAIGNGADSGTEDNDEYCASCGGEGTLLCCDGCPNSFHHTCLEPPLNPDEDVEGEWYCPRCIARRNKCPTQTSGLFGRIIHRVDDIIPKAFSLPTEIRDYFEGVKTGEEGEYEEMGLARTQNNLVKMNRAGFVDEPNYKELRDAKGNFILCYRCGLTSNGRDIIPCDYCPARWHLDCLDPPLAVPPRRKIGDKPNASWRCPLHVEHDLARVGRADEAAPGDLGRMPRLRKPKNGIPFDVSMCRGYRNNGVIEVDLMKDDPLAIKEDNMMGAIYRLPEKGIRLDFIDRVKRSWYEDQTFPRYLKAPRHVREHLYRPDLSLRTVHGHAESTKNVNSDLSAEALTIQATAAANAALRRKSFREQQAVLNLASFSQKDRSSISSDALADLTNQLVSEAPPEVVDAVQMGEREILLRLHDMVTRRLKVLNGFDGSDLLDRRRDERVTNGDGGSDDKAGDIENESSSEMDISS